MARGTVGQVSALVALRWRMLRTRRARYAAVAMSTASVGLLVGGVWVASTVPKTYLIEAGTLLPTVLLAFAVIALVSGIAAGGGTELVPASQLVAYPLSPRSVFVGSMLLAPLNITWSIQFLAILWIAAYIAPGAAEMATGLLLMWLFAAAATATSLAASWWVTGIRETTKGRWALAAAAVVGVGLVGWLVANDAIAALFDASPLAALAVSIVSPGSTDTIAWMLLLLALTVVAVLGGFQATAWTLRRREDSVSSREARSYSRRSSRRSRLGQLEAIDRASIWRSRPIRRGLVVIAVAPGLAAAIGGMSWQDLTILPGLVASGAALLFGVNAFCLDGSGAAWLESTPRRPRDAFVAKARVTAEAVLVTIFGTLLIASFRAPIPPTPVALVTLAAAVAVAATWTVAVAMRISVRRPYKADLRGPRDTPAPPAAMTGYSLRLALLATAIGLLLGIMARLPEAWPALMFGVFMTGLAARHLAVSARLWDEQHTRSKVVSTVAFG